MSVSSITLNIISKKKIKNMFLGTKFTPSDVLQLTGKISQLRRGKFYSLTMFPPSILNRSG